MQLQSAYAAAVSQCSCMQLPGTYPEVAVHPLPHNRILCNGLESCDCIYIFHSSRQVINNKDLKDKIEYRILSKPIKTSIFKCPSELVYLEMKLIELKVIKTYRALVVLSPFESKSIATLTFIVTLLKLLNRTTKTISAI
jgi:hypothetical protein